MTATMALQIQTVCQMERKLSQGSGRERSLIMEGFWISRFAIIERM